MQTLLVVVLLLSVGESFGQTNQNQNNNVNNINQGNNNVINSNAINAISTMNNGIPSMPNMANNGMPNMPNMANNGIPNMPNMANNVIPNMPNMANMMANLPMGMMNVTMMNMTNLNMTNMAMTNNTTNNGTTQQNLNVGNPDRGRIERPCETYDTDCIRRFFADRNRCKVVRGPIPDPFYRKQSVVYVPRVNLTVSLYDVKLRGFNRARIEEFYINLDTDKIVLAVEFRNVTVASNRTYLRFHRRGKEPVITQTNFTVNYQSLSLTGIIPQIERSLLDKTVVFAYSNAVPNYEFGPNAFNSTDPQVAATGTEFQTNPRANAGEILLTDSTYYLLEYIQYRICDFGLKVL